jgi:hypothetical protein
VLGSKAKSAVSLSLYYVSIAAAGNLARWHSKGKDQK